MSVGFSSGTKSLPYLQDFVHLAVISLDLVLCLPGRARELVSEHLRSTRHIYPQSPVRSSR